MTTQYIIVTCNIGNEDLLKFEMSHKFSWAHLSYSRKGFISFKNTKKELSLDEVSLLPIWFSRRVSLFYEKVAISELNGVIDHLRDAYGDIVIHNTIYDEGDECRYSGENATVGQTVVNIYRLNEKEVWISLHKHFEELSPMSNSHYDLSLPSDSPSRAWLKIAEASKRFAISFKNDVVLELGSAPGGASYYFLESAKQVIGVDPAEMSQICLEHKRFLHLKRPVQDLRESDFSGICVNWVAVDLNLSAEQSIKETVRLSKLFSNDLKGIICTIKMPKSSGIASIKRYIEELTDCGMIRYQVMQLESHKREILYIGFTAY